MEHLAEAGAATQRDLRDRLDASRTTVSRSLQSLEEREWVEADGNTYRLTPVGITVAEAFSGMLETIRTIEELSEFLRWFPTDEFAPDFLEADDVTVTTSTDGDPYAPARRQSEILQRADRLRILLPSVDLEGTKTITERITNEELEAETVIAPELEATMESAEFAPFVRRMLETGRATMLVSPTELPFYLGLTDDGCVQIGVEDDDGLPRSLLETTDGDVMEWAESVYRKYRAEAEPKSIAAFE
jgi:predicted transcriptional regulator